MHNWDKNRPWSVSYTHLENFRAYYDDINLRMKKKKAEMKPLDLCLVVGMLDVYKRQILYLIWYNNADNEINYTPCGIMWDIYINFVPEKV